MRHGIHLNFLIGLEHIFLFVDGVAKWEGGKGGHVACTAGLLCRISWLLGLQGAVLLWQGLGFCKSHQ